MTRRATRGLLAAALLGCFGKRATAQSMGTGFSSAVCSADDSRLQPRSSGLSQEVDSLSDQHFYYSSGCPSRVVLDMAQYDVKEFEHHHAYANAYNWHMRVPDHISLKDGPITQFDLNPTPGTVAPPPAPPSYPLVVGLSLDGVPFMRPTDSYGFDLHFTGWLDACNGRADSHERYHFMSAPLCLLQDMGLPTPPPSNWSHVTAAKDTLVELGLLPAHESIRPWLHAPSAEADAPESAAAKLGGWLQTWVDLWPRQLDPTQHSQNTQVGVALDGVPIHAPYDEDGNLIRWGGIFDGSPTVSFMGVTYGGTEGLVSTLDECNGYTTADGEYRYVLTPSPPWVLSCLRGARVFGASGTKVGCTCPDADDAFYSGRNDGTNGVACNPKLVSWCPNPKNIYGQKWQPPQPEGNATNATTAPLADTPENPGRRWAEGDGADGQDRGQESLRVVLDTARGLGRMLAAADVLYPHPPSASAAAAGHAPRLGLLGIPLLLCAAPWARSSVANWNQL